MYPEKHLGIVFAYRGDEVDRLLKMENIFCRLPAKAKGRRDISKFMVELMFIQRAKPNSELVYAINFIRKRRRRILLF